MKLWTKHAVKDKNEVNDNNLPRTIFSWNSSRTIWTRFDTLALLIKPFILFFKASHDNLWYWMLALSEIWSYINKNKQLQLNVPNQLRHIKTLCLTKYTKLRLGNSHVIMLLLLCMIAHWLYNSTKHSSHQMKWNSTD